MPDSIPPIKDHLTQKKFWERNKDRFKNHLPYPGYKKTLATFLIGGGGALYFFWAHILSAVHFVLAHNYPFMMLAIVAAGFVALVKTPKEYRGGRAEFWTVLWVGGMLGNFWGLYAVTVDHTMAGWIFVPGTNVGPEFYMILEDWTFYFGFVFFFYQFYHYFQFRARNGDFSFHAASITKQLHFHLFLMLTVCFLFFTSYAGRSLAILCAVPSLFLFIVLWKYINARTLTLFAIFGITVEVALDWLQVTVLSDFVPYWVGWAYVGFDEAGRHLHSKFFLDFAKYPWAWLWGFMRIPIEITPWFGISGIYFIYFLILGFKSFNRYKKGEPLTGLAPVVGKHSPRGLVIPFSICIAVLGAIALVRVGTMRAGAY